MKWLLRFLLCAPVYLLIFGCSDHSTDPSERSEKSVVHKPVKEKSENVSESGVEWLRLLPDSPRERVDPAQIELLRREHLSSAEEWLPVIESYMGKSEQEFQQLVNQIVTALAFEKDYVTCIEVARRHFQTGKVLNSEVGLAFSRLIAEDREMADQLLMKWTPGNDKDSLTSGFAKELAKQGMIAESRRFVLRIDFPEIRERAARASISSHLRSGGVAISDFIRNELTRGGDESWTSAVFEMGIQALQDKEPEAILETLKLAPSEDLMYRSISRLRGSLLLDRNPDLVVSAVELIGDESARNKQFRMLGMDYAQSDVKAARSWFESLHSDSDRIAAFGGIANSYALIAPLEFVDWVQSQKFQSDLLNMAIDELRSLGLQDQIDRLSEDSFSNFE